jgi:phage shock protein A
MKILRGIYHALRGGASEVGEGIVDANATRIFEQSIRDAETGINDANQSLSKLKSSEIGLQKKVATLATDIADYTEKAKAAMAQQKDELAMNIANKIIELTSERDEYAAEQVSLDNQVNKIHKIIQKRKKEIEKNKRELQKAKSYEQLHKTQSAVASAMPTNDSAAKRMQFAMDRVKQKQQDTENQMEANDWLSEATNDQDLDKKISAAGLGKQSQSAKDLLDSMRP